MAHATFKVGDKVTHHSHAGDVGTVVEVERDRYYSDRYTYHVAWFVDGPAIPYDSLTKTLLPAESEADK